MRTTLKQLRYMIALAEEGSFVAAAERVHVSQPALSLQIKEIESNLGVVLFERLPREVRLTRAGQVAVQRARQIMAEVADLEKAVRDQKGLSGSLKLGVIPTVAPYLLPLAVTEIRARDLMLELRIREAQTDRLIDELKRGRLDAAVMALPIGEKGLIAHPLFDDRFLLAGSKGRLAALADRGEALRPTEIVPDQLLLLDEGHCLADQALEVCGLRGRGRVDLGASSLSTLCGLVAEGFGLTLLPEIAVRTEQAAQSGLSLMRFKGAEPKRTLALVRRQTTTDDGWFTELAAILTNAGQGLLTHARQVSQP